MNSYNKITENIKLILGVVIILAILAAGIILSVRSTTTARNGDNSNMDNTYDPEDSNDPEYIESYTGTDNTLYANNKQLTVTDGHGGSFTAGVESSNANGLVIAPVYTHSKYPNVGYNISSAGRGIIEVSDKDHEPDNTAKTLKNAFINQTYDMLKDAGYYSDDNYGVCWTLQIDEPELNTDCIHITAVDLAKHHMLGSFTLTVERTQGGCFELVSLYNNDISYMPNERTEALWGAREDTAGIDPCEVKNEPETPFSECDMVSTRKELIELAIQEVVSGRYITTSETPTAENAIVELTDRTYYNEFLTSAHELGRTDNMTYPVWAVTLNSGVPRIGHYTFYFAKESHICLGGDFFYRNAGAELTQAARG